MPRTLAARLLPALLLCCTLLPVATDVAASSESDFWKRLRRLCGQSFPGALIEAPAGDTTFSGKTLVMTVASCDSREIRIPFSVGADRSRTWVLTREQRGLRLKHDHRHPDGTPDSITQYGGDSRQPAAAGKVEFPADAFTAALIPRAASNVWTIELETGRRFAYALRREGTDRRFRIEFDLTRPIP